MRTERCAKHMGQSEVLLGTYWEPIGNWMGTNLKTFENTLGTTKIQQPPLSTKEEKTGSTGSIEPSF